MSYGSSILFTKLHYIVCFYRVGVVDGREVGETEKQFLVNWKAMRKARRKQQKALQAPRMEPSESSKAIPTAKQILTSSRPAPPLTMPALPARQLPRRQKRHGSLVHQQSQFHETLPVYTSHNIVTMHQGGYTEPNGTQQSRGIKLPEIPAHIVGNQMSANFSPIKNHMHSVMSHRTIHVIGGSDGLGSGGYQY